MNAILNNKPEDKPKNRRKEILEEKGIKQTRLVKKNSERVFCIINPYVCNRHRSCLDVLFEIAYIL